MKKTVDKFLSPQEREQIQSAVAAAEKITSGEIVCMIVPQSYHYPMAAVVGATAISLPIAIGLTPLIGGWFWMGTHNSWLLLGLLGLFWILSHWAVKRLPSLKRHFISSTEMTEEVKEAAMSSFFNQGLYRTQHANGILVFISVFEHKIWILADRGIDAKVPSGQWDAFIHRITDGIRKGHAAHAICETVTGIARILSSHFPNDPEDTDELKNLILD
jgi:putative membrane protein